MRYLLTTFVLAASLAGCGGDSGPSERVRAEIAAHEVACLPGAGCSTVSDVTRLARGYWRFKLGGLKCIALDLNRFEVRLNGAGKREFSGASAIDCNYAPE